MPNPHPAPPTLPRLSCPTCQKTFYSENSLKAHKLSHFRLSKADKLKHGYQCLKCTKMFSTPNSLKVHNNAIHSGLKLHKCEICGKEFNFENSLVFHIRAAHQNYADLPFKCDLCPMAFPISSNLNNHKRNVHNAENPHKCPYCAASFKQPSRRVHHINEFHQAELKISPVDLDLDAGAGARTIGSGNDDDIPMPRLIPIKPIRTDYPQSKHNGFIPLPSVPPVPAPPKNHRLIRSTFPRIQPGAVRNGLRNSTGTTRLQIVNNKFQPAPMPNPIEDDFTSEDESDQDESDEFYENQSHSRGIHSIEVGDCIIECEDSTPISDDLIREIQEIKSFGGCGIKTEAPGADDDYKDQEPEPPGANGAGDDDVSFLANYDFDVIEVDSQGREVGLYQGNYKKLFQQTEQQSSQWTNNIKIKTEKVEDGDVGIRSGTQQQQRHKIESKSKKSRKSKDQSPIPISKSKSPIPERTPEPENSIPLRLPNGETPDGDTDEDTDSFSSEIKILNSFSLAGNQTQAENSSTTVNGARAGVIVRANGPSTSRSTGSTAARSPGSTAARSPGSTAPRSASSSKSSIVQNGFHDSSNIWW